MKNRVFFLLIIAIVAIILSFVEIKTINSNGLKETYSEVYILNKDVKKGEKIEEQDLRLVKISIENAENYFLETEKEIFLGNAINQDIQKGELILKNLFSKTEDIRFVNSKNNILVTFELTVDEANGWNIRKNQKIAIIFCPDKNSELGFEYKVYNDISVRDLYDNVLQVPDFSEMSNAKYVTVEIDAKDGYELINYKSQGRVEIIVM